MQKSQVLQKLKNSLKIIFIMAFCLSNAIFANTYEKPGMVIDPHAEAADQILIDEVNFALESFSQVMSYEDLLKAAVYISEYRKGDTSYAENLKDLISKYNPLQADFITQYMLNDNTTKLVAFYLINHDTNTTKYVKIEGLTGNESTDIIKTGDAAWKKITDLIPDEFRDNIDVMYLELYKEEESLMTICELDESANKWALYVDMRLLADEYKEELFKQCVYNTVYYYILRNDQIETVNVSKKNYSYRTHFYKKDSYINRFYERYWKGRRKEINLGQVSQYPNDFINNKASRTVYDDMAVSFYYYITNGIKLNSEKIKDKKLSFFKDYEIFNVLRKFFTIKRMFIE